MVCLQVYSLNFHSWRHIGHWWWTGCEFNHFIIQWMWKQWEHWPQTEKNTHKKKHETKWADKLNNEMKKHCNKPAWQSTNRCKRKLARTYLKDNHLQAICNQGSTHQTLNDRSHRCHRLPPNAMWRRQSNLKETLKIQSVLVTQRRQTTNMTDCPALGEVKLKFSKNSTQFSLFMC